MDQSIVGDPPALVASSLWIQQALLGTVAVVIATIAIAILGFFMLRGLIPWRRGASTIMGCFLIFGAPAIARGFVKLVGNGSVGSGSLEHAATEPPSMPTPPVQKYDPYAGASVPERR